MQKCLAGGRRLFLTQVLDGVVALLVVHLDGLGMRAANTVADGVAADHDVLVLGRRPTHHDAVDQRAHVQGAGLVRHAGFCSGERSGWVKQSGERSRLRLAAAPLSLLPSRSLSNVSAVVQSVAGPVPFTVTADTRKEYSVPRSRPGRDGKTDAEKLTPNRIIN